MDEIVSGILGAWSGSPRFYDESIIRDFRPDADLLAEWGEVNRREFRWQPSWGDWCRVITAKHPTLSAANDEARRMALGMGYVAPRWWQFWRIGEAPLPPLHQHLPR